MSQFALIYFSKEDRQHNLTNLLATAIGHPLNIIVSDDENALDEFHAKGYQCTCHLVVSAYILPTEGLLTRCCCPTFIIAHAGPWLTIMGGIITAKCVVQRLTDLLWLPVHSNLDNNQYYRIARIFYTLRESIQRLDLFYKTIKAVTPLNISARQIRVHPRFCPTPNTYRYKNTLVKFPYRAPLEQSDSCVTYRASTIEDKPRDIFVKFVTGPSYGEDAHEKMASLGFAPQLLYRFQDDLSRAFEELHAAGYVFGDLRESNVIVTSGLEGTSTAQLIDFDWAGKEGEVKYPISIPSSANWPAGLSLLIPKGKKRATDTPGSGQSLFKKTVAGEGIMEVDSDDT
ncbi:hypothetical protein J3R82DRAFT_10230 [Butyriboletus roseoflavus]|nr:hypothetical protein J3R82DRAFT_10230 [Butyriboletus roseoflavus]